MNCLKLPGFVVAALFAIVLHTVDIVCLLTNDDWDQMELQLSWPCGDGLCQNRTKHFDHSNFYEMPCYCDDVCWKYADCCFDVAKIHWAKGDKPDPFWSCEDVPFRKQWQSFSIYMISKCPSEWLDHDVTMKCQRNYEANSSYLLDVPVTSKDTNITYVNVFCAICHNDINLHETAVDVSCMLSRRRSINDDDCDGDLSTAVYRPGKRAWYQGNYITKPVDGLRGTYHFSMPVFSNKTKFIEKTNSRLCRKVQSDCPEFAAKEREYCQAFAYYVFLTEEYNNPFCLSCNDLNVSLVKCEGARSPFICIFPTRLGPVSFSILLDFNEVNGEFVGLESRCSLDEMFDPITKNCLPFYCGKLFDKIDGKCVPKSGKLNTNVADEECGWSYLNSSCPKTVVTGFTILDKHTVYVNHTGLTYNENEYEYVNRSVILICAEEGEEYVNRFPHAQGLLSVIISFISLVCLACHILVYSCVDSLRNLPGMNLLSLSCMLFLGQVLFLGVRAISYLGFCQVMAVIMHYSFLAAFFWMNVMAVDVCRTFTTTYHSSNSDCMKNYKRYSKYAWLLPAIIVGFALVLDNSRLLPDFSPRYGYRICWISRRKGLLLFFAIPLGVLLIENFIFFALTARGIYNATQDAKLAHGRFEVVRFYLYVKLAILMGLTWILGYAASVVDSIALWYVFVVVNASQGMYIFFAFTVKRKTFTLFKDKVRAEFSKAFSKSSVRKSRNKATRFHPATSFSNIQSTSTEVSNSVYHPPSP